MLKTPVIQRKLISMAIQILEMCSSAPDTLIKKYLDDRLIKNSSEAVQKYANLPFRGQNDSLAGESETIIAKLQETMVLLEVLRRSDLVSEEEVMPLVVECAEILSLIRDQLCVN